MAKAYRIYVDTSVFGGCFDVEFEEASKAFFQWVQTGDLRLLMSDVLAEELSRTPQRVTDFVAALPARYCEQIFVNDEAHALAEKYLEKGVLTQRYWEDALHVATASVARADIVVSWNFKHLVNFERIRLFQSVNLVEGYPVIDIRSPKEFLHGKDPAD